MENQFLGHINKKLIEREKAMMEFVSEGGCKTFEDYKELCGYIRGLKTAQFEIEDLVQKIKANDDEL